MSKCVGPIIGKLTEMLKEMWNITQLMSVYEGHMIETWKEIWTFHPVWNCKDMSCFSM